jgi:hypothetical protein
MSVRDLAALPVQDISLPDAVLFLWITVPLDELGQPSHVTTAELEENIRARPTRSS